MGRTWGEAIHGPERGELTLVDASSCHPILHRTGLDIKPPMGTVGYLESPGWEWMDPPRIWDHKGLEG